MNTKQQDKQTMILVDWMPHSLAETLGITVEEAITLRRRDAAAPELLEACKLALRYFDQVNFRGQEARTLAAAIAKAEGVQ